MKLITTRKFMLGLLIALLCFALVAVASITFSGNALTSDEIIAAANAEGYVKCNHEWAHRDATVLTEDGGQLSSDGNYYLNGDLTLADNITISGNVEICLNGHTLTGTGTGSVVTVDIGASFVLYDCSNNNTGKVTNGSAASGGGVYVRYGTFIMNGGAISGNEASSNGGGVYVDGGAFVMNGGTVEQNSAHFGGGVSVYSGSLDMDTVLSQTSMSRATADLGYGTFTLNNGIIRNNTATNGGGIYYSTDCTFTMNNGQIYGNSAAEGEGGGVWADILGTFTMTGGVITGNTANVGDGVLVRGHGNREDSIGKFNLGGKPVIFANGSSNVYLSYESMITIISKFEDGALIGVRCGPGNDGVITVDWSKHNDGSVLDHFTSDQTSSNIVDSDGEAKVGSGHRHDDTDVDGFLRLYSSRTLSQGKYYLEGTLNGNLIIDGKVELCLNGCTIQGDGTAPVITVNKGATLTLHDCNIHGKGTVTGGVAEQGAGVYVGGTFIMNGGVITANRASVSNSIHLNGGGVYVGNGSSFTMNGGKIVGNTAEYNGGGVYADNGSSFTMNGGTISENVSGQSVAEEEAVDAGVYLYGATFTMTGGVITNHGEYGVYVYNNATVKSTVKMSGTPVVSENKTANVYLYRDVNSNSSAVGDSLAIKVVGEMLDGAHVGVTIVYAKEMSEDASDIIATGWTDTYEHPMQYFFSDIDGKCIGVKGTNLTLEKHRYILNSDVNKHYNECPNCKDVIDYAEHVWDEISTYVSDGEGLGTHQKRCEFCLQKEGVKRTHVVTVATVTADGEAHKGACDDCGERGVVQNHTLETIHVDATCTENGIHKVYCTICEAVPVNNTLNALGHKSDGGKVTLDATCTENGVKTYTCLVCEEAIDTEVIDAFGHTSDGGKVTLAATCTEDGVFTYTCLTCENVIDSEVISMLGHKIGEGTVTTAPTCVSTGIMTYFCVHECGYIFEENEQVLPKIDHDWDEGVVTKEPTVEFDGVLTYTCKFCKTTKRSNIPALEEAPIDNTPVQNGLTDEQRYKIFWSAMLLLTVIVCSVTTIVVVIKKRK
ncbi:MAG: hypothetical protein J1G02_02590 [Clostridiales bacterium]|nr:hypothetical protein [Clostridiales bacterium]